MTALYYRHSELGWYHYASLHFTIHNFTPYQFTPHHIIKRHTLHQKNITSHQKNITTHQKTSLHITTLLHFGVKCVHKVTKLHFVVTLDSNEIFVKAMLNDTPEPRSANMPARLYDNLPNVLMVYNVVLIW